MSDVTSDHLDFSSSPVSPGRPSIGEESVRRIQRDAQHDWFASKRVVRKLKFGSDPHSTRYNQLLWVRRLEAFREITLQQDINQPYDGDMLIRFFSSMLPKLTEGTGRPPLTVNTIVRAAHVLIDYGHFKWSAADGFNYGRHGAGQVTDTVRQSLGHTHHSLLSGDSEDYVGGISTNFYNIRASCTTEPAGRDPRFATWSGSERVIEARGKTSAMLTAPLPLPPKTDPATLSDEQIAVLASQLPATAARELENTILP